MALRLKEFNSWRYCSQCHRSFLASLLTQNQPCSHPQFDYSPVSDCKFPGKWNYQRLFYLPLLCLKNFRWGFNSLSVWFWNSLQHFASSIFHLPWCSDSCLIQSYYLRFFTYCPNLWASCSSLGCFHVERNPIQSYAYHLSRVFVLLWPYLCFCLSL